MLRRVVLFALVFVAAVSAQSLLAKPAKSGDHAGEPKSGAPVPPPPHWTYRGESGPRYWGAISSSFSKCAEGREQSPINILTVKKNPELKPLVIAYKPSTANLVNNGKWIAVRVEPGSFVNVAGDMFELVEVRLRSPSEHRVRGLHFPLEAQLIHKSGRGGRMGISVSLVEGATNHVLSKLVGSLPVLPGRVAVPNVKINWIDFLPERLGYFTYRGSSTVPPCEQGWTWFVLTDYLQADLNQINTLRSLFPAGNDREPQPVFDRVVEEYVPAEQHASSSGSDHAAAADHSASSSAAAAADHSHAAPAAHH